jgi:hypothetical protein
MMDGMDTSDTVRSLERWEAFGGVWRVLAADGGSAIVSLCRCDGGEEVDRLTVRDRAALDFLAARPASDAPE